MQDANPSQSGLPPVDDDPDDVGELADIVGFNVRLAQGAIQRHFSETFSDLDLTQKQVSVLWLVQDRPGISQIGLSQRMRMDKATTQAIVNRLQSRDLLKRERSLRDGRVQSLRLTEEGIATLAAAKQAIFEHEAWVKSHFNSRELKTLLKLLARLKG